MKTLTAALAAAIAATALTAATAAVPCHLEAVMGLSYDTYGAADLLVLRGAVEEGALDVIAAITAGNPDDAAALMALAAEKNGGARMAALAD